MINIEHLIPKLKEYFLQEDNIISVWIVGSYGTSYQREDSNNFMMFPILVVALQVTSCVAYLKLTGSIKT